VCNYKFDAKTYLLGPYLDGLDIKPDHKQKIREVLASVKACRMNVTPYSGNIDLTWQVGWPESSKLVLTFIEDVVYTTSFDARYKDAKRSGLEVVDFLNYTSCQERLDEIKAAIAAEKPTTPSMNAAAGSNPGNGPPPGENGAVAPVVGGNAAAESNTDKTGFNSLSIVQQDFFDKIITKLINSGIKLIPDDGSTQKLIQNIRACPLAMSGGESTGLVILHFDIKKFGEPLTRPDVRITPIRDNYTRLVKTVLEARNLNATEDNPAEESLLQSGELALILDGGKTGNKSKLLAPWMSSKKCKSGGVLVDHDADDDVDDCEPSGTTVPSLLTIVKDEQSLQLWRHKSRNSTLSIKQVESCHILSHNRICLPERLRKHFEGTNCGDALSGMKLPAPDKVWSLSWKDKKALYGKKMLIAVGGRSEGAGDSTMIKRTDATMEPVCYHPMPFEFYDDAVHSYFAHRIIDLTCTDDEFAYTSLINKLGYVGICYTEEGATLLHNRLKERLKIDMAVLNHPLHLDLTPHPAP
jgi:hypothetical protein